MEQQDIGVGVRPGDVLAGKYRVERVLGAGGMGVVVAAHHIQLDEKVALKFLLPQALGNPEAVSRFVREARAAVKIKSEHVARVSDVGQLENGSPYMVMEFLDGGDLSEWLKQKGPMPIEQAVDFVLQACVAVADAHALGIVHRDLKPANLFCIRRSDGQLMVKVLDFGISKLTNLSSSGPGMEMTKTSALMGSPLYMSPEQMRSSKDVDATTDIWAIGIILFELLAGKPAFNAESVTELAIKVAGEPPPPLQSFRPDTPPALEAIILRCLEKKRENRYRNVGELAVALAQFAPKRSKVSVDRISGIIQAAGLVGAPLSPKEGAEDGVSAGTLPAVGRTTFGGRGKGMAAGGAVLLGVLLVGGGVTALVLSKKAPAQAQVETTPAVAAAVPAVSAASVPSVQAVPSTILAALPPPTESAPSAASPGPANTAANPVVRSGPAGAQGAKGAGGVKGGANPAPSAAAATPAAHPGGAKANCDVPYFFDGKGNRVFKPECM
jgi:serine/threonine-protein kinase